MVLLLAVLAWAACSRSAVGPNDALRAYYAAISSGEIETATSYLTQDAKENMVLETGSVEEALRLAASAGKIDRIAITNRFANVSFARISFRIHYEDGRTAEKTEVLHRPEGKWKIAVNR